MNHRTIQFSIGDIANDPDAVARRLTTRCQQCRGRISGLCQTEYTVLFPMIDRGHSETLRYVLAPFTEMNDDEIIADLLTRWRAGFVTLGMIRLSNSYLGLFECVD